GFVVRDSCVGDTRFQFEKDRISCDWRLDCFRCALCHFSKCHNFLYYSFFFALTCRSRLLQIETFGLLFFLLP
ncbi:hypothetical protein L9F63_019115, partial [Diploptera punctata]